MPYKSTIYLAYLCFRYRNSLIQADFMKTMRGIDLGRCLDECLRQTPAKWDIKYFYRQKNTCIKSKKYLYCSLILFNFCIPCPDVCPSPTTPADASAGSAGIIQQIISPSIYFIAVCCRYDQSGSRIIYDSDSDYYENLLGRVTTCTTTTTTTTTTTAMLLVTLSFISQV